MQIWALQPTTKRESSANKGERCIVSTGTMATEGTVFAVHVVCHAGGAAAAGCRAVSVSLAAGFSRTARGVLPYLEQNNRQCLFLRSPTHSFQADSEHVQRRVLECLV